MPAGKEVLGIPSFSHQQVRRERRDIQSCKPVSICKINEANLLPLNRRAKHGAGKGWPCTQNMHILNLKGSQKCYCCVLQGLMKYKYFLKLQIFHELGNQMDLYLYPDWHHTSSMTSPTLSLSFLIYKVGGGILPQT